MKIVLVGAASDRDRLRAGLTAGGLEIVGETTTIARARATEPEADALVVAARPIAPSTVVEPLTARELDVLRLLSSGLPNKRIAQRLGIGDQTVKFHVAAILGKLAASNRTDAVRRALRRGLIDF